LLEQAFVLMMLLGPKPSEEAVRSLANRLSRLVCEMRTSAGHDTTQDLLDRTGMLEEILSGSSWLTSRQVNMLQKEKSGEKSAKRWKREGRIFGVRFRKAEHFPAYQFDAVTHEPLPVIRSILEALGPSADPWVIAAWFHYPNGWVTNSRVDEEHSEPIAPMHALLQMPDVVLAAAASRRSSFAA
jgi:hypothetical protein